MADLFGSVFLDDNFEFLDGGTGRKLFVVLCSSPLDPDEVVVARTTSKSQGNESYGCHLNDRWANFCVPADRQIFNEDTWIKLDYVNEYDTSVLGRGSIRQITRVEPNVFCDLLQCALDSWDIPNDIKETISEQLAILKR